MRHHATHGESCACARLEAAHPFPIACDAASSAALDEAILTLKNCSRTAAACAATNSDGVQACQAAFFTLQAHHDHCEHGQVAEMHDHLVHEFEDVCHSCQISRAYDPTRPNICPSVDCNDNSQALLAFHQLKRTCTRNGGCCGHENDEDSGDDELERGAYELIMSYHDQCDHHVLPTYVERAVHAFAVACDSALCNAVDERYDGTLCHPDDPRADWGASPAPSPPPPPPPSPPPPSPPSADRTVFTWLNETPIWADTLLGMSSWIILFLMAMVCILSIIIRDVQHIKGIATRRASPGGPTPIFSSIATEEVSSAPRDQGGARGVELNGSQAGRPQA